jgi:hypothetical protein
MRFGRHENQRDETLLAAVGDSMILPRWRQRDLTGTELPLLIANGKHAAAFENVIDFILARVGVRALTLSRLETIGVAEKSVGFEDAVLFHFLRRKLHGVGKVFKVAHN